MRASAAVDGEGIERCTGVAPERTCAGCRAADTRDALFRLAVIDDGMSVALVPDVLAKLGGRHVSVHPRVACVRLATSRGGFSRALRREMRVDFVPLLSLMQGQVKRRVEGLLTAALRRRALVIGTDAVRLALRAGAAHLILVAKDAAGRRGEILGEACKQLVPALELSDKAELGRITGRATLGVLAIQDGQIAREILVCARWLAGLSEDG